MSPAQRVLARAAQPRSRVPSLAASQSPRGVCTGRRAVGQRRRPRSGYLRVLGELSGTRPRVCASGCQRSCLKPSRDGEAYGAISHRGTQRRPFGRVYPRMTPKAETPCAYGTLVRECHRSDVKCPLASRIWAERQAPHPMHRRACLGSRRPRPYRQVGMDLVVRCSCGRLRAGTRMCAAICHPLGH